MFGTLSITLLRPTIICVDRIFLLGEISEIMSISSAHFASLQLHWATTTVRLLGPTTCLAKGILYTDPIVLSAQQQSCEYHYLKSFDVT